MEAKLRKATLGEIADFTNGGAWNQTEYSKEGVPVVRVSDIRDETVNLSDCKFLPSTSLAKYERHQLAEGDLVICTVGSHPTQPGSVVGRTAIIPTHADGALLNQNVVRIRASKPDVDQRWLGYLGRSRKFHNYIISCARGSANQVRMAIGLLKEMPVEVPPLSVQRQIAGILSAYDELIENNQRRIRILEEMVRALYREWFVEFRFPGHRKVKIVPSDIGPIPQGWEVKKLGDLVTYNRRATKPGDHLNERRYVPIDCLPSKSLALLEAKPIEEAQSSLQLFEQGDILFGAMRPYFHKVVIAPFDGVTRTTCFVFKPARLEWSAFATMTAFEESTVAYANAHSQGATIPYAVWDGALSKMPLVLPPHDLLQRFEKVVAPMLTRLSQSFFTLTNLRRTRDLLLTRLLSGHVPFNI